MPKSKQHLYLFLEENELEYEISSSLVKLSMNRFVVNEDAQFEVMGIYNFKRATKEMADLHDASYKFFAKERTEKDAFDKDLISDAMDQATLNPHVDSHFIIGSFFHPIFMYWDHRTTARSNLFDWISQEIKNNDIRSIQCTLYHGLRMCLITNEMTVACYENKTSIDVERCFQTTSDSYWSHPQSSVHDDLEELIQHIEMGNQIVPLRHELFLHKMLTRNELQKSKNDDEKFWEKIFNTSSKFNRCKRDYTAISSDQEKKNKFVYWQCVRYSAVLK